MYGYGFSTDGLSPIFSTGILFYLATARVKALREPRGCCQLNLIQPTDVPVMSSGHVPNPIVAGDDHCNAQ
jgi:hypothetical protein